MPQLGIATQPARNQSGLVRPLTVDDHGAMLAAQRHGRDYEAAALATLAFGAIPIISPVTTSVALATTHVGLCLSNPAASGKNLSLLNVCAAFAVAPSIITTIGLAVGYAAGGVTVHTTAITPLNAKLGDTTTLVGKLDSACTLVGTPATIRILGQAPTATTSFAIDRDIDGGIIIPPGGWVAIVTNIAGPASGFVGSMLWEEITN